MGGKWRQLYLNNNKKEKRLESEKKKFRSNIKQTEDNSCSMGMLTIS